MEDEMNEQEEALTTHTPDQLVKAYARRGKKVVTLAGYSALGYQDPDQLKSLVIDRILDCYEAKKTIINIGATLDGIGAAYEWAVEKGFAVTGIVSSKAAEYLDSISPHLPRSNCFFVEDESWGGYLPDSDSLAPASEAIVSVSDVIAAFGGGEITRDELREMKKREKECRYFPLEMNHENARDRAGNRGDPEPTDFFGPLHGEFEAESI